MDIDGKLALVTGGSRGIGLAVSKELAARGASVWIAARERGPLSLAHEQIEAVRRSEQQRVGTLTLDVTDAAQVASVLSDFTAEAGTPDLLINCAGVAHPGRFEELDLKVFRWMMDVNYFGTVHVTKALVPGMIARGSGHIVNISSIAGFLGVYGYSAYGASKFAVTGLSDVLRAEMKHLGIGVSLVFPPDTDTEQLAYESEFKPPVTKVLSASTRAFSPERVARAIVDGVVRRRYIITPGFESSFYFRAQNLLGRLAYPVMDLVVARAWKSAH
ncbi:MAG: SDR family oxidoreductase [Actinobacteria bacterium]|nr:SDR family oxidoreductase [Actinomycetota bacterium]